MDTVLRDATSLEPCCYEQYIPGQKQQRPLDSRTRTTTSTRFNLIFFAYSQKIDTPESFIVLFFITKIAPLSILKEVKPSRNRKMIKLLTFDISFPPSLLKTRSRVTTATTFSRQNDAGSRVSTT